MVSSRLSNSFLPVTVYQRNHEYSYITTYSVYINYLVYKGVTGYMKNTKCLNCGKKLTERQKKFCSRKCHIDYNRKNRIGWYNSCKQLLIIKFKKEVYERKT